MIKDLSQSLDRRRKGIRNATWDLVFLYQWLKCSDNQAKENTLWLGASDDKALKRIGRRLLVSGDASEDAIAANLRALLEEEWGHERGSTIFAKIQRVAKGQRKPTPTGQTGQICRILESIHHSSGKSGRDLTQHPPYDACGNYRKY